MSGASAQRLTATARRTARARTSTWSSSGRRARETALDVATGGGHVARRLREAGLQVVTTDPAPGMQPDVVCRGGGPAVRGRELRRSSSRRVARAPLRRRPRSRSRDGARRRRPACSSSTTRLRRRGARGGRAAPRPVARPQLHRARSGAPFFADAGLEVDDVRFFESRSSSRRGSSGRAARARTRRACASSRPTGSSTAASRSTGSRSKGRTPEWRSSSTATRGSSSRA